MGTGMGMGRMKNLILKFGEGFGDGGGPRRTGGECDGIQGKMYWIETLWIRKE